ncbi:hypothetical protein B566_EDAN009409 [Ephemera danica]|nr:hypothetical protein B566_EDAN009409 [Ephemera danica]
MSDSFSLVFRGSDLQHTNMPFKPVEHPKCPKCQKSVYAAEERVAGGLKWHKGCFKCGMCNKMLDSTNCSEHEGELFCKICHARKYGPKGYGFGGGAGCLSMDTGEHLQTEGGEAARSNGHHAGTPMRARVKAPEGEGCPRCGGVVYAAEQMLARGRPWHKECFKCRECTKNLDSVNCCEGPDKDIYCKVCYGKKFGPKGYGYGQGGGALQCDITNGVEGPAAPRTTLIDTTAIKAPAGQGCPRCGGAVYAAEQVLAKGAMWHRKCFKCRDCTKTLDSVLACDGPDKEVYCKTCYGKKWGPHAGQGCPRCGGMVFAAEQQLAKGTMWHKKCFNCSECHRPLDSVLACDGPGREIYCKSCYGRKYGPKGFGYGHSPTLFTSNGESTAFHEARGGMKAPEGQGCPRCGYMIWHRRCFSCGDCNRSLDSTTLNDSPDGNIYCKSCYGKRYGPKGVGFGMGAGCLSMA